MVVRKTGGDDSYFYLAFFQAVILHRAENYFGVLVQRRGNYFRRFVYFPHGKVVSAGHGEKHAPRAAYGNIQKRRVDGGCRGLFGAGFASAVSYAHKRGARAL